MSATSTSVERSNSEAGREYCKQRLGLSVGMFRASMCVRSWLRDGGIVPPADRSAAAKTLSEKEKDELEDLNLSENYEEEVMEGGIVQMQK